MKAAGPRAFTQHLRFEIAQFDDLAAELEPHEGELTQRHNWSFRARLATFLLHVAHGDTFVRMSFNLGISNEILSDDYSEFVRFLHRHLAYEIQWPTAAERASLRGSLGVDELYNSILVVDATNLPVCGPRDPTIQGDFYNPHKKV